MPSALPIAEHPARRVAGPALTGLLEDVPVVIRALVERAKLKRSGAGPRLRRPGRDAERAGVVDGGAVAFLHLHGSRRAGGEHEVERRYSYQVIAPGGVGNEHGRWTGVPVLPVVYYPLPQRIST